MAQNRLILAVETSSRIGSVVVALGRQICGERTFSAPLRHSAELFPAVCSLLEQIAVKPKDIGHIYISAGPGSFTGLRIAVTMAKLVHLANGAKIVAVDTLDVIAANITDCVEQKRSHVHDTRPSEDLPDRIATVLDAKRGQFFIAAYQCCPAENTAPDQRSKRQPSSTEDGDTEYEIRDIQDRLWRKILPDSLMTAPEFLQRFAQGDRTFSLLGDGLLYHKDKFKADRIRFLDESYWSPRAAKLHMLGWQKAQAGEFADPVTLTPNYLLRPDIKVKAT
jgi:tRNA threonylcarbamoyladenosine biosynthesis protein TsaB